MNNFISQILLNLKNKNLSEIDKILLTKLKEESQYFIDNNATEIANKLYTNTTSINRFFKKCGFASYTHFLYSLKSASLNNDLIVTESVSNLINDITISKSFFKQKNTFFIIAKGASQVSSLYLARQLLILGYNAVIVDEINLIVNVKNPKLIVISQSGESVELITFLHAIGEIKEIQTLAITKSDSSISKLCDNCITHNLKKDHIDAIQSEQQLHMLSLINNLIEGLR